MSEKRVLTFERVHAEVMADLPKIRINEQDICYLFVLAGAVIVAYQEWRLTIVISHIAAVRARKASAWRRCFHWFDAV